MSDAYTGIRTRANIVAFTDEWVDGGAVWSQTPPAAIAITVGTQENLDDGLDLTDPDATIAALRKRIADMRHDWDQLNEFLNATARNRDWCSDYEDRIHHYNDYFRVLKLADRESFGVRSTWTSTHGRDNRNISDDT